MTIYSTTTQHADIDGVAVATRLLQPTAREPLHDVVFCHGTPWSSRVWSAAASELAETHRVFLWDMPGYGASEKHASVDLATQATRFASLLEHWRLDRPLVVAHDVGGAVALGAHLLHGCDVDRMFLWDVVTLEPWGSPFFRLVRTHEDVFSQLPADLHAALVKEYIAGAARRRLSAQWLDRLTTPWCDTGGQAAFYRQIAQLVPEDTTPVADRLDRVRCPVWVGWGEDDPWVPVEQAGLLRQRIPTATRTVILKDTGHLGPVERPDSVNRALREWARSPR